MKRFALFLTVIPLISVLNPAVTHAAQPSCTVSVVPGTINYGETARLSWTLVNATVGVFSGGKEVTASGSDTVKPSASRPYQIRVTSSTGETALCSTEVRVRMVPPTCTLSATPNSIPRGAQTNLVWKSVGAQGAAIAGMGEVDPAGSTPISPSQTTTYNMQVQNASGTARCMTTVVVQGTQSAAQNSTLSPSQQTVISVNPTPVVTLTQTRPVDTIVVVDDRDWGWFGWAQPILSVPEFIYDEVFVPIWEPITEYFEYQHEMADLEDERLEVYSTDSTLNATAEGGIENDRPWYSINAWSSAHEEVEPTVQTHEYDASEQSHHVPDTTGAIEQDPFEGKTGDAQQYNYEGSVVPSKPPQYEETPYQETSNQSGPWHAEGNTWNNTGENEI